jgi:hypothetical protein
VTKRGLCKGEGSKISWTQVETGSAITWKYPSCILAGDNSVGEFYSVAVTNNYQQADTGTKMIHLGRNTRSTIVSKGISAGHSQNSYRGLVKVSPRAEGARNHSQCDSLLLSSTCGFEMPDALEIADKTYVNVNIHKKENEDKLKQLAQLPDSCVASADCLEKQRAAFEKYNVFSPAMIDGIISKLRAYEDRTLRSEVQDSPEEMLKLVEKYFHCG